MMRSTDTLELIEDSPLAFALAAIIAFRARFMPGKSIKGLYPGEALIGDCAKFGMTRQQYRTAIGKLVKWQFATIKTTRRGTVAKLMDTRLFDVLNESAKRPLQPTANHQATNSQPVTKNGKTGKNGKNDGLQTGKGRRSAPTPLSLPHPTEDEVFDYGEARGHDVEAIAAFFKSHEADGWTIRGAPSRDWKKALAGFVAKFESDRARG